MQKDRAYYMYQHKKHALRHKNITQFVYKIENYFSNFNKFDSFKIHCDCCLCRSKTNPKDKSGSGPTMNWCPSDQRKLDDMKLQIKELYN